MNFYSFFLLTNTFIICDKLVSATHIKGTFNTDDFYKFLVKFGFQKTDRHSQKDSFGYIFGNITSKSNFTYPLTFAVLDRTSFLEYYGNSTILDKDIACERMFHKLNATSYDPKCNKNGQDFLRRIPCKTNELCVDEDTPWNVIKGNQFTYVIRDLYQPRYTLLIILTKYFYDIFSFITITTDDILLLVPKSHFILFVYYVLFIIIDNKIVKYSL